MRQIKVILIVLLVVTTVLFGFVTISNSFSGKDVAPTISCSQDTLLVSVLDDDAALLTGVTARDEQDGDLTNQVLVAGVSKLITDDTAKVTYLVFDSDQNMDSCTRMIRYTDYRRPRLGVGEPLVYESPSGALVIDRITAADVIDGDLSESVRVSTIRETDIENVYSVTVQVTNSMGDTARVDLPVIIVGANTNRPEITLKEQLVYLEKGAGFDPRSYIADVESPLGTASTMDVKIENPVDTQTEGSYWVIYRYTSGNSVATAILTVIVE